MKRYLLLGLLINVCTIYSQENQLFVVVTASYNNARWYKMNLSSIFGQHYENFYVLYVDDASTDGTADLVQEWVKRRGFEDRITIIRKSERQGALANQYRAIQLIPDRAIVCIVDGDDWLAPQRVFSHLNKIYSETDTWMTYGQFMTWPGRGKGWCIKVPQNYVKRNAYREFERNLSHLRTFYAGLFKQIKVEDLMFNGSFLSMCADNATMFPMAEMARNGHMKFINEMLYVWNGANELNDHKVSKHLQRQMDLMVRSLPRYEAIETPFQDNLEGTIEELEANIQWAQDQGLI